MERAKRMQDDFAVLLLDIDFFKKVNDTCRNPVSDAILIQLATIAKQSSATH